MDMFTFPLLFTDILFYTDLSMHEQIMLKPLPKFSSTVEKNLLKGCFEDSQEDIKETIAIYVYTNWGCTGFKGQDCYRWLAERLYEHYSDKIGRKLREDMDFWVSTVIVWLLY